MEISEAKGLKALEDENTRLKTLSPNGCWMQRTPRASRKKCMVRLVVARDRDIAK